MSSNKPFVLGLTGSIAMGKTTVARQIASLGVPALDSDAVVHELMAQNKTVITRIGKLFPEAMKKGAIERKALAKIVFEHPEKLKALEAILHPEVRKAQDRFIKKHAHEPLVVLDIPLLYETGGEERCDAVAVVTAPAFIQRRRSFARTGMTEEKYLRILARQMPDHLKRKRADFVIRTGSGMAQSLRAVKRMLAEIMKSSWPELAEPTIGPSR